MGTWDDAERQRLRQLAEITAVVELVIEYYRNWGRWPTPSEIQAKLTGPS